jgi:hypothetical protein
MTKRLQVVLTDEEARAVKLYADTWDITISDVLKSAALQHVNQHALCCKKVNAVLESIDFTPDKRASKSCYGFPCRACKHTTACRTGIYEGEWEIEPKYEHYVRFGNHCHKAIDAITEGHDGALHQ